MQKSTARKHKLGAGMAKKTAVEATIAADQLEALVTILDLIRSGSALTRSELIQVSGLGRAVVTQRVAQLVALNLVDDGSLAPSTGGRAPRGLRFTAESGNILVAELGATGVNAGLTDLSGNLLVHKSAPLDIAHGAEVCLTLVEDLFYELLTLAGTSIDKLWGVGIGVPGPVEFATGRPISPPIMPGWDNYPIRDRFAATFHVPVWVDNEVNLMALGELRTGLARGLNDVMFVKIGTGIGAGIISGGRLHRGAQGCAGDIGHVAVTGHADITCRCGNTGCLEALAGGAAIGRDGEAAAREGRSQYLAEVLQRAGTVQAIDVAAAARHGDPVGFELLTRAGRLIGESLASFVNFFNPSLLLIGGGVTNAGDHLLATVRESVYRRSLPLATRELRITRSALNDRAGMMGAAFMVTDELFGRVTLPHWIDYGCPTGRPEIATVQKALAGVV
jgi:glucokinase-like ROK family protein